MKVLLINTSIFWSIAAFLAPALHILLLGLYTTYTFAACTLVPDRLLWC